MNKQPYLSQVSSSRLGQWILVLQQVDLAADSDSSTGAILVLEGPLLLLDAELAWVVFCRLAGGLLADMLTRVASVSAMM